MGSRRQTRIAAACACAAIGLVACMLVRRAGSGAAAPDPDREAFLESRRERMRTARSALLATGDRSA
jgi:hypothetical protein